MSAIRERWFADDWEITQGDNRDVELRDGQLGTPQVRGANAIIPNRTGETWRPKLHDAGTFTLHVWLGTYQRQAQALWDELLQAVVQPHRLVTYRRITAAGETRYCQGEVIGALQPTAIGQAAYRAAIEVHVPSGYWRGEQQLTVDTWTQADDDPNARIVDLSPFSTSTAPLEELTLTLAGELPNPKIADTTTRGRGDWVSYAGTIPDGGSLILDCATWGINGGGGFTPSAQAVNYSGDRFLTLAATPPGIAHSLRVTADSFGAGSSLTVSGYRSYLV
jgi:hypothetical protein